MKENRDKIIDKRRLRNYLINRHGQLSIAITTLLYMSIICVVTVIVALYPLMSDIFFSHDLDIQYRASQTFLVLINKLLPVVIAIFVMVFLHQIIITHRVWGPLVNFKQSIKMIASGDLTRKVFLRKRDYLKQECEQINYMIDSLTAIVSNIKSDHKNLMMTLDEFDMAAKDISSKELIGEHLDKLRLNAKRLLEDISQFKIE